MTSPAGTAQPSGISGGTSTLGTRIHNLVVIKDSGNDFVEFRVQCEVRIPTRNAKGEGEKVLKALASPTADSLRMVEDLVTPFIDPEASENFRATIRTAFVDNLRFLEASKR